MGQISERDCAIFTLDWNNLCEGKHTLLLNDECSTVEWTINVIKPEEDQSNIENAKRQFSWSKVSDEWKERQDNLTKGEKI